MQGQCSFMNEIFVMLAYYNVLEVEKAHCFRVEATILEGAYFLLAASIFLAILNSFVMKANFQHFWDKDCVKKEEALDERLTVEESASPIDDKTYRKIRPPPVLFTDTFRWLLRLEHLGDRPLKSDHQPLKELVVEDHAAAMNQDENLSSDASCSPKSVSAESLTRSIDDTLSKSASADETDPLSKSVGVESNIVDIDNHMSKMQVLPGSDVEC